MLGDQLAAVLDQLVGAFLLGGLIVPGAGEGHVHGDGGADGLGTQIEAGVAGNDFGVGEGTHVAHLGFLSGEFALLDHLVQLQTGSHTGQIPALVDGGKGVVVVAQALGVGLGAGGVAELHIGELLGSLDDVILVAEGVGEDDVAAGIGQLAGSIIGFLTLRNVGAEQVLIFGQAQGGNGLLGAVHEVQVVGGVLIVQEDEAQLHVGDGGGSFRACGGFGTGSGSVGSGGSLGLTAAGHQTQHQNQNQSQRKNLFHVSCFLLK